MVLNISTSHQIFLPQYVQQLTLPDLSDKTKHTFSTTYNQLTIILGCIFHNNHLHLRI